MNKWAVDAAYLTDIDIISHALQDMAKTLLQLITWLHHQLLCSLPPQLPRLIILRGK